MSGKFKSGESWQEKLADSKGLPRVEKITDKMSKRWGTLKSGGQLNGKYPGGVEAQTACLEKEGHVIEPGKGKKPPKVKDFEKHLAKL